MEQNITCPCCFNDERCFEEKTKNDFSSYMCFNCGMTSNSLYVKDSKKHNHFLENSPMLVRELQYYDEDRGIYWYPAVINMNTLGIIFPEGNVDNWIWKYAKVIKIPKSQQKEYPIPGKKGEFYETQLDVDGAEIFGRYEFLNALYAMGIVKTL